MHREKDKTSLIPGAKVTLALPDPQVKQTGDHGEAVFASIPSKYAGRKFAIKATHPEYYEPYPQECRIVHDASVYLSLIPRSVAKTGEKVEPKEVSSEQLLPKLSYFIYVSDAKIEMLEEQILPQEGKVDTTQNRFRALSSILAELKKSGQIGDIFTDRPFINGEYALKWGVVDWGVIDDDITVSFFFSAKTEPILLMAGSVRHLVGKQVTDYAFPKGSFGYSGSALPGIMRALRFSYGSKWTENLGGDEDYFFAHKFTHEKYINPQTGERVTGNFLEQNLIFVARVLKRLKRPSEEKLSRISAYTKVPDTILQETRDILICTPLFVALAEKQ